MCVPISLSSPCIIRLGREDINGRTHSFQNGSLACVCIIAGTQHLARRAPAPAMSGDAWHLAVCHFYSGGKLTEAEYKCFRIWWLSPTAPCVLRPLISMGKTHTSKKAVPQSNQCVYLWIQKTMKQDGELIMYTWWIKCAIGVRPINSFRNM